MSKGEIDLEESLSGMNIKECHLIQLERVLITLVFSMRDLVNLNFTPLNYCLTKTLT